MTLTLPPAVEERVRDALDHVIELAIEARAAPDTDAIKGALAAVWHAVHRAHEIVRDAESVTRSLALTKFGDAA